MTLSDPEPVPWRRRLLQADSLQGRVHVAVPGPVRPGFVRHAEVRHHLPRQRPQPEICLRKAWRHF